MIVRDPLGAEAAMAATLKKYAYPADAEVVEVGTGGNTGKVKVRLPGELTPTADLPWAPVVGSVPAVSDRVLALVEFASRRVITGGTGGGGGAVSSVFTRTGAVVAVSGDYTATQITNTPAGSIAATTVQAAITELDADHTAHLNDTVDAHDASAISYAGGTGMSATEVESAIDELATEKSNTGHTHAAADTTTGVFNIARLATGTPDGTKFVRDDGTLAVPSGGGGAADPITDPEWFDDFLAGGATTGTIGALGWEFTTATVTQLAGEAGHPGILRRTTAATVGQIISTQLRGVVGFLPAEMFDITFSFRSVGFNSAQFQHKMGLLDTTNTAPANGIYIEQTAGTANIIGRCRAAGVNTDTAAIGTLVTDTWTKIRIRRISGSQVGFTKDGGTELTLSSGIPTAGLIPVFQFLNGNATARSHDIDYFKMKITGLTR